MTAMIHINSAAGMRDLIDLAREIESCEKMPRKLALRVAMAQLEDLLVDVAADVRYCPTLMHEDVHVCWSLGVPNGLRPA